MYGTANEVRYQHGTIIPHILPCTCYTECVTLRVPRNVACGTAVYTHPLGHGHQHSVLMPNFRRTPKAPPVAPGRIPSHRHHSVVHKPSPSPYGTPKLDEFALP